VLACNGFVFGKRRKRLQPYRLECVHPEIKRRALRHGLAFGRGILAESLGERWVQPLGVVATDVSRRIGQIP
jgi:hypothetical protein